MSIPHIRVLLITALLSLPGLASADGNLKQAWRLEGFSNPESALYDTEKDVVYVSNVNGPPGDKDGNGFISRIAMNGTPLDMQWVTGLNAPKGMAVVGNSLYVADIDTLVEINTGTGQVANRYVVPDAKFMNDVTAGSDGSVFVSDTGANRIYRLAAGKLDTWLEDPRLDAPNGLLAESDRIIVGTMGAFEPGKEHAGQLLSVSFADKSVSSASANTTVGHLDGVEADGQGGYLVTDWPAGKILRVQGDGSISTVHTESMGTADLDYVAGRKFILLPLMMDNALLGLSTD